MITPNTPTITETPEDPVLFVNRSGEKITRAVFNDVCEQVEDMDLPDGAHWAMLHDILDIDYGDAFEHLVSDTEEERE